MHVGLEDCSSGVYSLLEWCQLCVLKWLQQSLCGQSRGAGGCDTTGKQQVAVLGSLGLRERQHEAAGTMIVVQLVLVVWCAFPRCWPRHLVLFETFCMPASDPYSNLINLWIRCNKLAKYKLLTK